MRSKQMFFALVAMLSCFVLSANAQNVAKIGDTEYATLSEAIKAATAGQTITFIGDVNENDTVNKSVTIDGADFKYTGTLTANNDLTVTVQNVNFVNAGFLKEKGTKGTYTIKDCTFDGADKAYGYAVTNKGARTLTIENCTVKDYSYGFLYNSHSLTYHSVKDVTVENCNYGVRMGSCNTTNLVNFVTSNVKWPVQIQANAGRTVNMTDCSIYEVPEGGASLSCWQGTSEVKFNFKGTNVFDAELPGDANFIYKDANGNQTENNNNGNVVIVKPSVAKIGEQGYESLSAAVAAAKADDVITFVADITEDVTVSKSLTIDGAGKTYTGNIAFKGSTVAATVKNVNFVDGSGYAITTNTIKSITVENCTVTKYGYGFLYANKSTSTVTVKNVKVDGCNYGFHWVYGTSATLEDVKMTNVTNGLYIQNYANKTITLKNCEISSIEIWERTGYSGVQTFKFKGVNEVSSLTASSYAKIVAGAQVGTKLYETLDAAFAAAQDGDEVKVLTAGTYALSTSGKNLTITGAVDGVVFDNIGAKNMGGANVTFNNVTFDYYPNVNYTGLQHSGNLVYNNCTINGQVFLYGQSETFNKCTFNQNSADAYNVWTYGAKDVDFNECTFNSVGKSVLVYTESTTATNDVAFTNCELIASAPVDGKAAIEIDTSLSAGATITVDGATTATGFANGNVSGNSLWNNKKGNADAANNDVTVIVNDVTVLAPIPDVAKIGETGYRTLAAAVAAAPAGGTVTLIADATEAATVELTKNLTIDGAGYTFTGKMNITSNKGTVTIKNVNFDGKGYNGYAVETRGVYYLTVEDCTAKNYDYGFLQMVKSTVLTTVKNVTVSDMNYGVKVDYATAVVLENVDMTARVAAVLNSNYGEKTITIKDSKLNIYGTWTRNNTTKTNVVFEGANTVGEFKADAAIDNFKLAAGATLTAPEAITATTDVDGCEVAYVDGTYSVVEKKNYVVKIDEQGYETLQDAVAAAKAGETVTVLTDIVLDTKGAMANCGGYPTLVYVEGKAITIDLNGKNITANAYAEDLTGTMLVGVFSTDNGGKLTLADSEGTATVTLNANGAKVYSVLCNFEEGCQIKVEGGTYVADKLSDSMIYSGVDAGENEGVTVNGGNFTLGNLGQDPNPSNAANGKPWIFNTFGQNQRNVVVNGGTFNADVNHQFWANEVFVPETKALKNNGDGTWTVVDAVAYTMESVTSNNATERKVGYATVEEAMAATNKYNCANNAVAFVKDLEIENSIVVPSDVTVVLDLNGKTVTMNDASGATAVLLKNNGNLTIMDGTEAKAGKLSFKTTTPSAANAYASNTISNYGTLTIESGNVENLSVGGGACYALDNYAGSTATINGGKLTAKKTAVRIFNWTNGEEAKATINMNGGEIYSKNGYGINVNSGNAPFVALNITGGTIATDYADYKLAVYVVNKGTAENFTANVTGGTFNGIFALNGVTAQTMKQGAVAVSGGTFEGVTCYDDPAYGFVSGGTFESVVDAKAVATGYATVDNHDGTWTVESLNVDEMTIDYNAYGVDDDFENQNVKTVGNLTYKRKFKESVLNKWQTLYVPFEVPVEELVASECYEIAYLNGVHAYDRNDDSVIDSLSVEYIKIKSGTLYANTPYMIKPKKSEALELELVLNDVTLYATDDASQNKIECASAFVEFQFGGTYEFQYGSEILDKLYGNRLLPSASPKLYYAGGGEWWNGRGEYDTMKFYAFDLYFALKAKANSPYKVDIKSESVGSRVIGEENEDGTTTIYDVPEEIDVNGMIFDLSGRRVNETEKGIYIKDGKKVLVK